MSDLIKIEGPLPSHAQVSPHYPSVIPVGSDFDDVLERGVVAVAGVGNKSVYRLYDEGVKTWFQTLSTFNGGVIPTIMANPQRAFSDYTAMLGKGAVTPFTPKDAQASPDKHPLPFCSVVRKTAKPRPGVQSASFPIRNIGFIDDSGKRRTAWMRPPSPVFIPYSLDVWIRNRNHANFIDQRLREAFWNGVANWRIVHPLMEGTFLRAAFIFEDLEDVTDLEKDSENLIRLTLSMQVEGWLWHDLMLAPTATQRVDEIVAAENEAGDGEVADTIVTKEPEAQETVIELREIPVLSEVAWEVAPPAQDELTTETGDQLVTESGQPIVL